ncbi:MAG: hypothetical protein ACLSH6_02065 [Limosilactobacillus pontis]
MKTNTYDELISWLHGRDYDLTTAGTQLRLSRSGKVMAVVTRLTAIRSKTSI